MEGSRFSGVRPTWRHVTLAWGCVLAAWGVPGSGNGRHDVQTVIEPARAAVATRPATGPQATGPALTTIEFAPMPDWSALRRRVTDGVLVLDLSSLEDVEAARALAGTWRRQLGAMHPVQCWLREGRDASAPPSQRLIEAAGQLAEATEAAPSPCARIVIPLPRP